jgi:hypothetical protein
VGASAATGYAAAMDDRSDEVTRLGPDSGGRSSDDTDARVYSWEWGTGRPGRDEERRPGLPWIGIFLLVFGGLLLLQQLYPESRSLGSMVVLAIGLAFLIRWTITRGTGSLYAGAIITALAIPDALGNAGLSREGMGTLSLGVAFLFIAAVRWSSGGGIGWQALFGGLLTLVGAVDLVQPQFGGVVVPVALVVLGVILIFGGSFRQERRRLGPPG